MRLTRSAKTKARHYAARKLSVNPGTGLGINTPYTRSKGLVNTGLRKKAANIIRQRRKENIKGGKFRFRYPK